MSMPELTESYWMVSHTPDLTETGRAMNRTYVRVKWCAQPTSEILGLLLVEWCRNTFGSVVKFVQGVTATPGWRLVGSSRSKYLAAEPIYWGGVATETKRVVIELGKMGSDSDPFNVVSCEESTGPLVSVSKEELSRRTVLRFDGPPGTEGPRFIESERDGKSISAGDWVQDGDNWLLVLHDDGRSEPDDA